jgi:hypothetical protein
MLEIDSTRATAHERGDPESGSASGTSNAGMDPAYLLASSSDKNVEETKKS